MQKHRLLKSKLFQYHAVQRITFKFRYGKTGILSDQLIQQLLTNGAMKTITQTPEQGKGSPRARR